MKRGGIINARLSGALAQLGHTDLVVVCDAGLPVPSGSKLVDLAFRFGVPSFESVLSGLLEEIIVESAVAASEIADQNLASHALLRTRFPELELVSHEELKRMTFGAKLFVRTGEATPYSNVVLRCGVPF